MLQQKIVKRPAIWLIIWLFLFPCGVFPKLKTLCSKMELLAARSTSRFLQGNPIGRQCIDSRAALLGQRLANRRIERKRKLDKVRSAKLDLFADEIHVLNEKGVEVVATKGLVKKIAYYDRDDTATIAAFFQTIATRKDKSDSLGYVQVLNDGDMQIVKKIRFRVFQDRYDPIMAKHDIRLSALTRYQVANKGELATEDLTKSQVILFMRGLKHYREWIRSHPLKSEEDIIAFLNYHQRQEKSNP